MRTLYVLGGTISYRHEGGWQLDYNDQEDRHGPTGNVFRVVGAYYAWAFNMFDKIIFVGDKGFYTGTNAPTIAHMMFEDVHRLGVPYDNLGILTKGSDTLSQLEAVKDDGGEVIMSATWHLPRISIMSKIHGITLSTISAEDLIAQVAPYWKPLIERYNANLGNRLDSELRGIYDSLCGHYGASGVNKITGQSITPDTGSANVTVCCQPGS